MFVVIFEVQPRKERWDDYLDIAKQLKPMLEAIDGFIDNERFASHRTEGRLLSLSTWRDEKSVIRWRTQGEHHCAQQRGRFEVFADYRLRVGEVTDDSSADVVLLNSASTRPHIPWRRRYRSRNWRSRMTAPLFRSTNA